MDKYRTHFLNGKWVLYLSKFRGFSPGSRKSLAAPVSIVQFYFLPLLLFILYNNDYHLL